MDTTTASPQPASTLQTGPLKAFATAARTQLLREVGARLTVVLSPASQERVERPRAVAELERAIKAAGGGSEGQATVVDTVAYTWFNRIVALRFMDAHGYTTPRLVSAPAGQSGQPEVLVWAKRGQVDRDVVPGGVVEDVIGLLAGTRQARPGMDAESEAFSLLLTAYCHHWHRAIPAMFEQAADYTELLLPADILAESSVMSQACAVLTEEVCADVEVIGWLYQFYISERKDEVFAGFKKNKKAGAKEIPPATQLFTPHWIVKYLVENSVGRLWMLNHPQSRLVERMDYYIEPVQEVSDFLRVERPEDLTVVDPAAGSGHMLTYAFDLLYAIYEEQGYAPSQIPSLILTHNLVGAEIDPRAGSLAAFALTMKAAGHRRLFLRQPVTPRITVLEPVSFSEGELQYLLTEGGNDKKEAAFWNQFEHADTFGSLIQPDAELTERLAAHVESLSTGTHLLDGEVLERARTVIHQAQVLARRYAVVVANPPYMGSKQMNPLLSQFMKKGYPLGKQDLFAAFMVRALGLAGEQGVVAMITMQSWMFLSTYEKLRRSLLEKQYLSSMAHLGTDAFDTISGAVVSTTAFVLENVPVSLRDAAATWQGVCLRLVDGKSEGEKVRMFLDAIERKTDVSGYFTYSADNARAIPGSPLAYWLSEAVLNHFKNGTALSEYAELAVGLQTSDNDRFLRLWWEVADRRTAFGCTSRQEAKASGARWFPFNKGGEFRRWYGNQEYVVNWEDDGRDLLAFPRSVVRNPHTYFSPSVSWSDITSGAPSFRKFPKGFIHGNKGNSLFCTSERLDILVTLLNSTVSTCLLGALTPTMTASVGDVAKMPFPWTHSVSEFGHVAELESQAMMDWDLFETSWNFRGNPLVRRSGPARD